MRVTNNAMTRNYLLNLNHNMNKLNNTSNRLQTGRKFTKMSQNVSDGTRSLNIRTQMYKNEQVQENVKKAGESLSVAETNLMNIEDILNNVYDQTLRAVNGTMESASNIYSINFDSMKDQVIEFANCTYNDCYVLGGTNNQEVPFQVQDGELFYNGVAVNSVEKVDDVFYSDGEEVPYSKSVYMDIGIGMSVRNGKVDPRTAFDFTVSGLDALGYGETEITYEDRSGESHTITAPNNAYELLDDMARALDEKDFDRLSALNDHLRDTVDDLITEIADIGVRTKYLDNHSVRLEDEEFYMTEIQSDLEYIEDTKELIDYKSHEYAWQLTLQYGGSVIPKSLMDYVQ